MKISTLVALASLGGIAHAEVVVGRTTTTELVMNLPGSARGASHNYLVRPAGGELTGQMRMLMSDPAPAGEAIKFSDVALFGLGGRYSLSPRIEVSLDASFLAKQSSSTDEKPWQSVGGALRTPISRQFAAQLSVAGGHLIDHEGMWTKQALLLQWRHRVAEILHFDIAGGLDGVSLSAPDGPSALIGEVAVMTSALFRAPNDTWAGWVGLGYAVPIASRGADPTTEMDVDPQPRLDFRIGTVVSLKDWDLFAELAIVDRGDVADPATRLPILDGGFDQRQVILGVTRHFKPKPRAD